MYPMSRWAEQDVPFLREALSSGLSVTQALAALRVHLFMRLEAGDDWSMGLFEPQPVDYQYLVRHRAQSAERRLLRERRRRAPKLRSR